MPDIFLYADFRKYLSDYYLEQKEKNSHFSYQMFATKAGIANKGFLYNIVRGTKPLSDEATFKIVSALKLHGAEKKYFETLVRYNRTKDVLEGSRHHTELERIRNEEPRMFSAYQLEKEQFGIYSSWYHSVIRSLLDMYQFDGDFAWLGKMVYPAITEEQAKYSVCFLEKLGLVYRDSDGFYGVTNKTITTGTQKRKAVLNFHYETLDLARKSLQAVSVDKRNVSGLTLGISQKMYKRMCKEIELFQERLLALAEQDNDADTVYQLDFHFFPMSQTGE